MIKVIEHENHENLARIATQMMEDGWRPSGGITPVVMSSAVEKKVTAFEITFILTMVKEVKK